MRKHVSASERLAGLAILAMAVVALGGGGYAVGHIIQLILAS